MQPEPLLEFWFGALADGFAAEHKRKRWFEVAPAFDAECSATWGPMLAPAAAGELNHWLHTARGRLAFVVLCDQIPRNVYRGRAQAFAWDELALAVARDGIALGEDRGLGWDERSFFYLPFEHSEDIVDQHTAVGLLTHLRDESPAGTRHITGNYLRFAHQHRDIVLRFGRFPHRNSALGRASTPAEQTYMADSHGFGQT